MREIFEGQQEYMGELFSYVVKSPLLLTGGKSQICKHIRLLDRWIRGKDPPAIRRDFESYFGTIAAVADGMSWIMGTASLIAQSTGAPKTLQDRLSILSERLLYGVEEGGLELSRLRVRGLGRAGIKILITEQKFNSRDLFKRSCQTDPQKDCSQSKESRSTRSDRINDY